MVIDMSNSYKNWILVLVDEFIDVIWTMLLSTCELERASWTGRTPMWSNGQCMVDEIRILFP